VRGEREEKKKITLFASILQSSHVTKFNCRYHASGNFVCRVFPPIIISNGSTRATATTDDYYYHNTTTIINNINTITAINTRGARAAKPSPKCNSCHN
jgi:hypothetical protein